jgi:hypothetical protein
MKNTIYILTLLTAIILLHACKRDDSSGCGTYSTNYHTLSTGAINQTPYFNNAAFDTISFASDKGDTVKFVKTKTDSTWYCESDNSNADCPKEKANCYQILHNVYTTVKGNGSFEVRHSLKNSSDYDRIEITINNVNFSFYDRFVGSTTFGTYKNSITINNKIYYKIIKIYEVFEDVSTSSAYINKDYGVFQMFDVNSNTFWYLVKI